MYSFTCVKYSLVSLSLLCLECRVLGAELGAGSPGRLGGAYRGGGGGIRSRMLGLLLNR